MLGKHLATSPAPSVIFNFKLNKKYQLEKIQTIKLHIYLAFSYKCDFIHRFKTLGVWATNLLALCWANHRLHQPAMDITL